MIQAGTTGDLISAIQAAVDTDTSLLLGLWGSAGQQAFDLELVSHSPFALTILPNGPATDMHFSPGCSPICH